MSALIDNIAAFLAESPEWVESWMNAPVKKMSIRLKPSLDFPDFAVSFFNNLPIEQFNKSLKLINRAWYRECRRELKIRRDACIEKYWAIVDSYKEARTAHKKLLDDLVNPIGILDDTFIPSLNEIENRWHELGEKKESAFEDWVDVDIACLNCGFPDLIDHKDPKYYIKMYDDDLEPYEIPTQDEL